MEMSTRNSKALVRVAVPSKRQISVSKPAFFYGYSTWSTAKDLVEAIKAAQPGLLDVNDGLEYAVVFGDNVRIPLSGSKYLPEAPLPSDTASRHSCLNVQASIKEYHAVRVVYPGDHFYPRVTGTLMVRPQYTLHELEQKVAISTKIPAANLRLQVGADLCLTNSMDVTLYDAGIRENCTITIKRRGEIKFRLNKVSKSIPFAPESSLHTLLEAAAIAFNQSLTSLLFGFRKTSGRLASCAKYWLSDSRALFQAESAVGTIHENGLLDKDEVDMHPFNAPSKRPESRLSDSLVITEVSKRARHNDSWLY
jgi:hypothetical protein